MLDYTIHLWVISRDLNSLNAILVSKSNYNSLIFRAPINNESFKNAILIYNLFLEKSSNFFSYSISKSLSFWLT
jgi:hypothetical protein